MSMIGTLVRSLMLLTVIAVSAVVDLQAQEGETPADRATAAEPADDEQAIRDVERKALEAAKKRDAEGVAATYAEDALYLSPGSPAAKGRGAIRAAWAAGLEDPDATVDFSPRTVEVSEAGDMAYVIGDWSYSSGGAGAVLEKGTYVMVYVKRGGQWQALVDISHTTPPAK